MQDGVRKCMAANGDAREIIDRIQSDVLSIEMPAKSSFTTAHELAMQASDRYDDLSKGETGKAIPTGFKVIDTVTRGGFSGAKLIVISARPSVGKTALMQNLVRNNAERGHKIGVFELEMDKEELADRWFGQLSGMNPLSFTGPGGPNADQSLRLVDAAGQLSKWNMLIDDSPADIGELKRRARLMKKAGCEIIYIDQLSKISGHRNLKSFDRFTFFVEELSFLKKELRIPIVLLCQVNRKAEERPNQRPTMADLKNTGQIEEDADIVFLGSKRIVQDGAGVRNLAEWEIAKHRGGPVCRCFFEFIDRLTEFVGMEHDEWKKLTKEK
jgi:replicative DNA helicase